MGASPIMSLGIKAMAANFAALQATGHNIANANVDGYSRQSAVLATSPGQFTGAGFFGRGVDVVTVTRSHNEFLTRETTNAQSLASMDSARLTQLQRLEGVFQPGESGLGYAATELFNAMVDLGSHPADGATRQVVLARASDLAQRFNEAGSALDTAQNGVTAELRASVADINRLAQGIASTNQRIAALKGAGQPPNDLLDERDRLISELSSLVQVSTVEADDGTVGVFIAGGQRLVLGDDAATLRPMADPDNLKLSALGIVTGGELRVIPADGLGGGSLNGLLRFQNDDLQAGVQMLDQLAQSLVESVNAQQVLGFDQLGNPGEPLFTPVDPLLASPALSVRVAITDPRGLAAASATADNGNALELTALRDEAFVNTAKFPNTTFVEAYAQLVGEIGVRVQGAQAAADISAAVATSAETARASKSGVNLDEEAAMLIQYQQSYQAAAKILQIAQSVFKELLETAGR
jgi:flagellar hook-associated protein 1